MHMLSVDIHITRCYDDLIRKQELNQMGKSSKRIRGIGSLEDNYHKTKVFANP